MRCPIHHDAAELETLQISSPAEVIAVRAAPLMPQLRASTRPHHERVEAWPVHARLLDGTLPCERWIGQLHAYGVIQHALERACGSHAAHPALAAVWTEDRARAALLTQDLKMLDPAGQAIHEGAMWQARALAARLTQLGATADIALLGALYVFEGSALGNLVLRKHVMRVYGLEAEQLRFLEGHGQKTAARWREFGERVDGAVPGALQGRVIAGACEAFERMSRVLGALSEGV